jgi:hypothetical protein
VPAVERVNMAAAAAAATADKQCNRVHHVMLGTACCLSRRLLLSTRLLFTPAEVCRLLLLLCACGRR